MKSENNLILELPIRFKKYSDEYVRSYITIYAMKKGYFTEEMIIGLA